MTTTTNLIERLRKPLPSILERAQVFCDMRDAADLLEAQAKQIEALQADSERYNFAIEYLVSERTDLDDAIVAANKPEDITKVIDAARKGNV